MELIQIEKRSTHAQELSRHLCYDVCLFTASADPLSRYLILKYANKPQKTVTYKKYWFKKKLVSILEVKDLYFAKLIGYQVTATLHGGIKGDSDTTLWHLANSVLQQFMCKFGCFPHKTWSLARFWTSGCSINKKNEIKLELRSLSQSNVLKH